jgi:hypothetical protein
LDLLELAKTGKEIDEVFEDIDIGHNAVLSFDEFYNYFNDNETDTTVNEKFKDQTLIDAIKNKRSLNNDAIGFNI